MMSIAGKFKRDAEYESSGRHPSPEALRSFPPGPSADALSAYGQTSFLGIRHSAWGCDSHKRIPKHSGFRRIVSYSAGRKRKNPLKSLESTGSFFPRNYKELPGGGGGSRTPVREPVNKGLYVRSRRLFLAAKQPRRQGSRQPAHWFSSGRSRARISRLSLPV